VPVRSELFSRPEIESAELQLSTPKQRPKVQPPQIVKILEPTQLNNEMTSKLEALSPTEPQETTASLKLKFERVSTDSQQPAENGADSSEQVTQMSGT